MTVLCNMMNLCLNFMLQLIFVELTGLLSGGVIQWWKVLFSQAYLSTIYVSLYRQILFFFYSIYLRVIDKLYKTYDRLIKYDDLVQFKLPDGV